LLLVIVVGLSNLVAASLHFARSGYASLASFASGNALAGYVFVEMLMLRSANWTQLTYFALGLVIAFVSTRRMRETMIEAMPMPPAATHA
jgi:hypothetical protein